MVTKRDVEDAIKTIIEWIGDEPQRSGLLSTPGKVADSYKELLSGYGLDAKEILSGHLYENLNQKDLVILKNIAFTSFCEHHILPFSGYVNVAYVPTKGVIGFDRISRIVDMFARRLQLQERMTNEIANALFKHSDSEGVAVSVTAQHSCMSMIGSRQNNVDVYSESLLGSFLTDLELRKKFVDIVKSQYVYEK